MQIKIFVFHQSSKTFWTVVTRFEWKKCFCYFNFLYESKHTTKKRLLDYTPSEKINSETNSLFYFIIHLVLFVPFTVLPSNVIIHLWGSGLFCFCSPLKYVLQIIIIIVFLLGTLHMPEKAQKYTYFVWI